MKPSSYLKNLQASTNWRAQYNPLRGLTIAQLVTMLEAGERGNYARLQWLYRFVEKRNPMLRAVLQRRQASLTRLDWDIRFRDGGTPRTLAARQAAVLREAYEAVGNLREAVTFLALAEFRGYAHLERHFDKRGRTVRLQPVPQWFWARTGPEAPWQYNAQARPGLPMPGDPVLDPARFIFRENDSPIDEIAVIAHVRQSLSQKDWDGFVETYGLPPLFLELPPDIPAEREAEYQAQAEAIIGDARGTMPNGTKVHTVDSGARGQNPFAEHLRYQDEMIVLAATGGKLTVLAEPGSGTLAGSAHQKAFDDITESEAALISEVFQEQFDRPLLSKHFPGQPQLAYLRLIFMKRIYYIVLLALIVPARGEEVATTTASVTVGGQALSYHVAPKRTPGYYRLAYDATSKKVKALVFSSGTTETVNGLYCAETYAEIQAYAAANNLTDLPRDPRVQP